MGENINSRQTVQNNILDMDTVPAGSVYMKSHSKSAEKKHCFKLNVIPRQA